jgi:alanine racemase
MVRPTHARVHLDAIRSNFQGIDSLVGPATGIIAVVKANAYGHGAGPVGRALEEAGAQMLGVADIEEGIVLRQAGVRIPILVFGALSVSDVSGLFEFQLVPTISTPSAARTVAAAAAQRGVESEYHLKIDTGLNRLGFRFDNLRRTLPDLLASRHLRLRAVFTHFATADDPESPLFELQRRRFDDALQVIDSLVETTYLKHAANSAALLRDERVWFDFVRPGLLLYGVVPPPLGSTLSLRPALSLESKVVAIRGVRPGEAVGYGSRFIARRPTRLAVIPAGYADGLDVRLAGRGFVSIRGKRASIVGSVSMDMITADVTEIEVNTGDAVLLLGESGCDRLDVREIAASIGTIPYELLCRIGARIERIYT